MGERQEKDLMDLFVCNTCTSSQERIASSFVMMVVCRMSIILCYGHSIYIEQKE